MTGARLHFERAEYAARIDGILAGRHFPGLTQSGDCLAVVAVPRA